VQESLTANTYRNTTQYYHWFQPGDGRMWRLVDAALGDWRYDYNGRGQLTTVSKAGDATVPTRTWTYDAQGRVTAMSQPESGTSTTQYNTIGNITYTQDARGASLSGTTYTYDSDHRLTVLDAPGTPEDVTTTYDAAGRAVTVANATVQTTVSYDTSSRVTGRTDVIAGRTFSQLFAYDGYDNLIQVDYPLSQRKVYYDYDTQQRLVGVRTQIATGPMTTLASGFVYRGDGSLASYIFGNGQTASVSTDVRQRPATWVNGPLNVTYTYDHVGNVTSLQDNRDPGFAGTHSSQFSYDLLDRITAVTGFGATTFDYTPGGDRNWAGPINFHYDATTRRLMSLSGGASGSFSYNAIGSLTSDPSGATYDYNAANMMKTSTLGGQTTAYLYGGSGMRAVKTAPNGTQLLYVYGAGGGPIGEYTAVGGGGAQIVREYVYLGSQLLASFAPSPVAPPPVSVAIVTPTNNTTVPWSQSLQMTASVTAGPGVTVARVEYYNGGLYIGQSTGGNYPVTMAAYLLGSTNTLIARAVTTDGRAVSSSPVTFTVQ
jgi:YD repeat-containing protein